MGDRNYYTPSIILINLALLVPILSASIWSIIAAKFLKILGMLKWNIPNYVLTRANQRWSWYGFIRISGQGIV